MNILTLILVVLFVAAGGAALWFFVIHKRINAIHKKLDTIIHRVVPAGANLATPSGPEPIPDPFRNRPPIPPGSSTH